MLPGQRDYLRNTWIPNGRNSLVSFIRRVAFIRGALLNKTNGVVNHRVSSWNSREPRGSNSRVNKWLTPELPTLDIYLLR